MNASTHLASGRLLHGIPWIVFLGVTWIALTIKSPIDPDSPNYIQIANGDIANVIKPFSSRFLMPLVAGMINSLKAGGEFTRSFFILQCCSAVGFFGIMILLEKKLPLDPFVLTLSFLNPLLLSTIQEIFLPDLGAMVIIALIILFIAQGRMTLSLLLLLPGLLIRESLVIFGAIFIIYLLRRRLWTRAAFGCFILICGLAVSSWVTRDGPGNVHAINPLIYFALKLPVNFVANFSGVTIWTDTYMWCSDPFFSVTLPAFVHAGKIRAIGLCWADPIKPIQSWSIYVLGFGILPGWLFALIMRYPLRQNGLHPAIMIALSYGLLMALIGPMSGHSIGRLIYYGWSAFGIALPALVVLNREQISNWKTYCAAFAHIVIISLWQSLPHFLPNQPVTASLLSGILALIGNVVTYRIMRREAYNGKSV